MKGLLKIFKLLFSFKSTLPSFYGSLNNPNKVLMKKSKKPNQWGYFAMLACICVQFTWAQNPVDSWTITTSPAPTQDTYTVGGNTYEYGQGNNVEVTSVTYNGNLFTIPFASQSYVFKRVDITPNSDGVNVVGDKASVFFERTGASNFIYEASLPGTPGDIDLEEILKSTVINRGSLDVFKNTGDNTSDQGPSNIERVDVVFPDLTINNAADLPLNGFLASEKSGNNTYKAAAILSLDANGEPASYGNLVTIVGNTSYGIPNDNSFNPNRSNAFNEDSNSDNLPIRVGGANERIGISLITFADLGITAGQTFFGISFFGDDVFDGDNLLDPTTFPQTTGTGADIYGALGAIVTATGFEPPLDSDGDLVPDSVDLDNDNDGILDSVENSCPNDPITSVSQTAPNQLELSGSNQSVVAEFTSSGDIPIDNNTLIQGGGSRLRIMSLNTNPSTDPVTNAHDGDVSTSSFSFDKPINGLVLTPRTATKADIVQWTVSWTANNTDNATLVDGNPQNTNPKNGNAFDLSSTGAAPVYSNPVFPSGSTFVIDDDGELYEAIASGAGGDGNINFSNGTGYNITLNLPDGITSVTVTATIQTAQVDVYIDREIIELSLATASIDFCDSDDDGTPDYLDTDSDNDGCPDAVEAAGAFTTADLTTDDNLANTAAGVDTDGIPTIVGAGQGTTNAVTDDTDATACLGDPPVADDETATTDPGTLVNIPVLTGDDDPDGDNTLLTITEINGNPISIGNPVTLADGTIVALLANGTLDVTPGTGVTSVSFDYTLEDEEGLTDVGTVDVTVNQPPVADDETATTDSGTLVNIPILTGDDDPDGDNTLLTITEIDGNAISVGNPVTLADGTVVALLADGTLDVTPGAGVTSVSFGYTLEDEDGLTDTGTVDVTVNPPALDSDMDGIPDTVDLDDDNDGILDSVELACNNGFENISAAAVNASIDPNALHDGSSTPQTLTQDFTTPGCPPNQDMISYQVTAFPSQMAANTTILCADVDSFVGSASGNGDNIGLDKLAGCDGGIRYRIEFTSGAEILNLSSLSHGNMASDEAVTITSNVPLTGATFKRANADASNNGTSPTGGSTLSGNGTTSVTIDNISGTVGGNLNIWEVNSNGVPVTWVEIDYYRSSGSSNSSFEAFTLNHTLPCDSDCDGTPDYLDTDSDNDGCPDAVEAAGAFTTDDLTADDNLANVPADVDATNGIPTVVGAGQGTTNAVTDDTDTSACDPAVDSDMDGIPDTVDLDDDNDGIPDLEEGQSCVTTTNLNSPGFPINTDFATGPTSPVSLNGLDGGIFNFTASVSGSAVWANGVQIQDNPAIGNYLYGQPENTDNSSSANVATYTINFPNPIQDFSFVTGGLNNNDQVTVLAFNGGTPVAIDASNFSGLDNGVVVSGNVVQGTRFDNSFDPLINVFSTYIPGTIDQLVLITGKADDLDTQVTIGFYSFGYCIADPSADFDGDGIPNALDLDSDNDGIPDIIEAGGTDNNNDGEVDYPTPGDPMSMTDANMDGLDDGVEANPLPITNTDALGGPNYLDIDADDDGIPDNIEAQTTAGYVPPSGVGMAMTDVNMNGVDDAYESGGVIGISPVNTDSGFTNSDAIPDYIDDDSDGDGIADLQENGSSNIFLGVDTDGDGLDDAFDDNDDSAIAGATVNDGINPPNAASLGDVDGDLGTGGDVDYRDEAALDSDGDGVTDDQEIADGTDPNNPCNFETVSVTLTQTGAYLVADCDGDGVTNGDEIDPDGDGTPGGTGPNGPATNPVDPCDFNSGDETVAVSGAYLAADCDGDGVTNGDEIDPDGDGTPGGTGPNGPATNPVDPCDFNSGDETVAVSGAYLAADCDGDGVTNGDEIDPDGDGTPGGTGPNGPATNPLDPCDFNSGDETVAVSGAFLAADCDGDGVTNGDEIDPDGDGTPGGTGPNGPATNPLDPCDFNSGDETVAVSGAFLAADCDSDGLTNGEEISGVDDPATTADPAGNVTDPFDPDTDGDGNNDATDPNSTIPTATDDSGSGIPEVPVVIDILGNDDYLDNLDPANLGTTTITDTGNGTAIGMVSIDAVTGELTYTPDISEVGTTVTVIYEVCNDESGAPVCTMATVTIDVGNLDSDGDGVTDDQEIADGTDPNNPCDFEIASITVVQGGDWLLADCDGDGVTNEQEVADGTNPEDPCDFDGANITVAQSGDYLISDCDGDGVTNGTEITDGTDPENPCDFIEESITLDQTGDWLLADCDGDTIDNGTELDDTTDPFNTCSSLNGVPMAGAICDVEVETDLVGPGLNEGIFRINNIEEFPNNTVRIYNRWGILVYETQGYDNANNAFRGISNGRATIQENNELPVGVYFYVIEYLNDGNSVVLNGYLYVNR